MGLNVSVSVALLLRVRLTKGNNWSEKKSWRAEELKQNVELKAQFIGSFTVSKDLQLL